MQELNHGVLLGEWPPQTLVVGDTGGNSVWASQRLPSHNVCQSRASGARGGMP